MVPYSDSGHLTKRQKNYNYCHSSSRTVIERAFGLLKARWRSLLNVLAINRMDFTAYHILACCVLHNICLLNQDEIQLQDQVIVVDVDVEETKPLPEMQVEYNCDRTVAEAKRSNICASLCLKNA
ncbi:hypothetical protein X777_01549 [Ooceraea biroi]|uniref:DDE Tnp4 domain-containing protein n=2 Tax=Ooceraea biroi TaxID=2015173 RepID=A0A026WQ97_OOCBI|nr:hypothetical protein X777_01549 [Ooceraea biroi]